MKTPLLIGFPHAGSVRNYAPLPVPSVPSHRGQAVHVESEHFPKVGAGAGEYLRAFGAEVFTPRVARPDLILNGWAWAGTGNAKPSRTDWGILPPNVDNMASRTSGDITGAQGTKHKRARAVGAGIDPEVKRALDFDAWLAADSLASEGAAAVEQLTDAGADVITIRARAAIAASEVANVRTARAALVADILAESTEGQRILTLAGGKGYGSPRHHGGLNSGGMAARAARHVKRMRGSEPSATSISDAAAEAAGVMWFQWCVYSALCGDVWNDTTVHHLARYGWRAAFNSMTRDAAEGRTGREAGRTTATGGNSVELEAATLSVERESLNAWARDRQGRIFDSGDDTEHAERERRERKAVLRWIASVLAIKAKGRTGAAERARFSMLARLIHGRDIATASRGAGFASGRAAIESFRSGQVWPRLRAAISTRRTARDNRLRDARASAVHDAMLARDAQRRASAGAGRYDITAAVARAVQLTSGAASVQHATVSNLVNLQATANRLRQHGAEVFSPVAVNRFSRLVRVTRPASSRTIRAEGLAGRGTVHPDARAWAKATEQRGQAVATARAARTELRRSATLRLADFDAGTRKLRSGWLR